MLADARARVRAMRARGVTVWFALWHEHLRPSAWGERAVALATHGARGVWGRTSARWASARQAGALPDSSTECSVCLQDYVSPLPTPALESRSAPGRWACTHFGHAVCRGCDFHCQSQNPRCPACRADRVLFVGPWQPWPYA